MYIHVADVYVYWTRNLRIKILIPLQILRQIPPLFPIQVYVGEIVEEACQSRESSNEEGPLQPKHVREAVRRLRKKDKVPNSRYKKVFPFR